MSETPPGPIPNSPSEAIEYLQEAAKLIGSAIDRITSVGEWALGVAIQQHELGIEGSADRFERIGDMAYQHSAAVGDTIDAHKALLAKIAAAQRGED